MQINNKSARLKALFNNIVMIMYKYIILKEDVIILVMPEVKYL